MTSTRALRRERPGYRVSMRYRDGRYNTWFIVLMIVAFVVIVFPNWTPALIALAVVIGVAGLGQLAGLWHPRRRG